MFFFVDGGPRREDIVCDVVRWVPGPGEYFEEGASGWPGRAMEGRDMVDVVAALLVAVDILWIFWGRKF